MGHPLSPSPRHHVGHWVGALDSCEISDNGGAPLSLLEGSSISGLRKTWFHPPFLLLPGGLRASGRVAWPGHHKRPSLPSLSFLQALRAGRVASSSEFEFLGQTEAGSAVTSPCTCLCLRLTP